MSKDLSIIDEFDKLDSQLKKIIKIIFVHNKKMKRHLKYNSKSSNSDVFFTLLAFELHRLSDFDSIMEEISYYYNVEDLKNYKKELSVLLQIIKSSFYYVYEHYKMNNKIIENFIQLVESLDSHLYSNYED